MNRRDFIKSLNRFAGAVWIFFHPSARRHRQDFSVAFNEMQRGLERDIGWRKKYAKCFDMLIDDPSEGEDVCSLAKKYMPDLKKIEVFRSERSFAWQIRGMIQK